MKTIFMPQLARRKCIARSRAHAPGADLRHTHGRWLLSNCDQIQKPPGREPSYSAQEVGTCRSKARAARLGLRAAERKLSGLTRKIGAANGLIRLAARQISNSPQSAPPWPCNLHRLCLMSPGKSSTRQGDRRAHSPKRAHEARAGRTPTLAGSPSRGRSFRSGLEPSRVAAPCRR